jgi:hypothetical protein
MALNIDSGKTKWTAELNRWEEEMHEKICQKRRELEINLNRLHKQTEVVKDDCKKFLVDRLETKVGRIFKEQLQQDEINVINVGNAQNEFVRLQETFHLLNSTPLIDMQNVGRNQLDFDTPGFIFPSVNVDGFDWMKNFSTENTVEIMERTDSVDVDLEENINYRNTGKYALNRLIVENHSV